MSEELRLIRSNRRGLRSLGLTSQTLQCVETFFALKARRARAGQADVARVLGVSRSIVSRHIARAEAAGLLVKIGRTLVLMRGAIEGWSQRFLAERAAAAKARASKRWKTLTEPRCVRTGATHTGEDHSPGSGGASYVPTETRAEALAALRACYIPPHMRQARAGQ